MRPPWAKVRQRGRQRVASGGGRHSRGGWGQLGGECRAVGLTGRFLVDDFEVSRGVYTSLVFNFPKDGGDTRFL